MTIKNRETVRDYLVGLLDAVCVGDGKPAEAIYGYLVGDFEGKSPVIVVASAGTEQEKRAVTSRQKINFYFTIYTFTLYAQEGTTWGEDDVEDRLGFLKENRVSRC